MIQRDDRPDILVFGNASISVAPHLSRAYTIQRAGRIEWVFWKTYGIEGVDWLYGHHSPTCDLVQAMGTARALVR